MRQVISRLNDKKNNGVDKTLYCNKNNLICICDVVKSYLKQIEKQDF